jgi:hypothetical protein
MKIGIITDTSTSNYNNMYPHLRESQVWMKKLVEEGHELFLLGPYFSNAMWKKFHGGMKDKFQEHFQDRVGVKPTLENDEVKIDLLMVVGFPWIHAFNYAGIDLIKKHAAKVENIVWVVIDYEMYSPGKSLLYDILPIQHHEIIRKIKCVITTDPTLTSGVDKPHHYMPHLYDPSYEIKIKPKSERTLLSRFCGPIGFRKSISDFLPELSKVGVESGLRSEFWGEDYAKKYRDSQFNFEGKFFDSVDVFAKRVSLPYNEYLKFMSDCVTTFHDSYPPTWLDKKSSMALWYSGKINDALYAGVDPLTTKFINSDLVDLLGLTEWNLRFLNETTDVTYESIVKLHRFQMNEKFGIDTWYPKLKEWLFNG